MQISWCLFCFVVFVLCRLQSNTHTYIADETGHLYINRHALLRVGSMSSSSTITWDNCLGASWILELAMCTLWIIELAMCTLWVIELAMCTLWVIELAMCTLWVIELAMCTLWVIELAMCTLWIIELAMWRQKKKKILLHTPSSKLLCSLPHRKD